MGQYISGSSGVVVGGSTRARIHSVCASHRPRGVSGHPGCAAHSYACGLCYHAGMQKQAPLVQYTIRGVPREVDLALRRKAAKRKLSLNQVIVEELRQAATGARKREDFSDLVGKWTPDAA